MLRCDNSGERKKNNAIGENRQCAQYFRSNWRNVGWKMCSNIATHTIGRLLGQTMLVMRGTDQLQRKDDHRQPEQRARKALSGEVSDTELFDRYPHVVLGGWKRNQEADRVNSRSDRYTIHCPSGIQAGKESALPRHNNATRLH